METKKSTRVKNLIRLFQGKRPLRNGLDTRILRKVNNFICIIPEGTHYSVQTRNYLGLFAGMGSWRELNVFSTYRKAVERKNMYIVMVIMRELGYRNELVRKRTKRKREKGLI